MTNEYKKIEMSVEKINNQYKIEADLLGVEIELITSDAELDKYYKDYYDPYYADMEKRAAYPLIIKEACKRFKGALVNVWNDSDAEPWLIETDEQAVNVINDIINIVTDFIELTPDDDEEFTDACERLGLDPEANDVRMVHCYTAYDYHGLYVCMPEDYKKLS